MKWDTRFKEFDAPTSSSTFWEEDHFLHFSVDEKNYFMIRMQKTIEDDDVFFEVWAGMFFHNTSETLGKNVLSQFKLELKDMFYFHKGETEEGWWCVVFKKHDLDKTAELVQNIKVFCEDYLKASVPKEFISVELVI